MWHVLKWTDKIIGILIWINFLFLFINIYIILKKKISKIYKSHKIINWFIVIQSMIILVQQLLSFYNFKYFNIPKKEVMPGIDIFNRSIEELLLQTAFYLLFPIINLVLLNLIRKKLVVSINEK